MLDLFIASSSEARQRGIVPFLITKLRQDFNVIPWHKAFEEGLYTIEALQRQLDNVDIALIIFTKDDKREIRDRVDYITRDNVILEYGLFLSKLDRERMCVLREEGVTLPTDLLGLTVLPFSAGESEHDFDPALEAELEVCIRKINKKWKGVKRLKHESRLFKESSLGVVETLKNARVVLDKIEDRLTTLNNTENVKFSSPIFFDASRLCISTYAEALRLVKSRFWTTTYLSSGFWTKADAQILSANRSLLRRLKNQGDIRRLFLLRQPPADEVESWKEMLLHLTRQGRTAEANQRAAEFHNLRRDVGIMLNEGCQVKIVFDELEHERLPKQLGFSYGDSELAIYDDFRVDIFGGGRSGRITDVGIFSNDYEYFEDALYGAKEYFEELWKDAEPIEAFLAAWEERYNFVKKQVEYSSKNWLTHYEFLLSPNDNNLKLQELKSVERLLRESGRWGHIRRYLDVGTCSARYPLGLSEAVIEQGEIIGIDNDIECVRLAESKTRGDSRIRIMSLDFAAIDIPKLGEFDLITCMLGTLAHFGWDKNVDFNDTLQRVLQRIANMLSEDGILIFSIWSEHARNNLQMIDIYKESSRQRLAEWTPGLSEIMNRLEAVGLTASEDGGHTSSRLNLIVCKRQMEKTPDHAS